MDPTLNEMNPAYITPSHSKCFLLSKNVFFFLNMGSSTQGWMPTYVSILRIPQMI
jgi:hypothetical protein